MIAVFKVFHNKSFSCGKLKSQSASDVNRILPALKEDADIKDNRKDFNY